MDKKKESPIKHAGEQDNDNAVRRDDIILFLMTKGYQRFRPAVASQAEMLHELQIVGSAPAFAIAIAKTFGIRSETIDHIIGDYISALGRTNPVLRSVSLPHPADMLVFAGMGASPPMIEKLALAFAKSGYRQPTIDAARIANRKVSAEEVGLLVDCYNSGPSRSNVVERELNQLASQVFTRDEAAMIAARIAASRARFDVQID